MIYGSSTRPRANGPGWEEPPQWARLVASPEPTARWECQHPETIQEAAAARRLGKTSVAISGSSGEMAMTATPIWVISMTFGSSILPPIRSNGHGGAEAKLCPIVRASVVSLESTDVG